MQPSNSGNQEDSERLVTCYLPLLATIAVALPLLYVILCFNTAFLFEWLAFLLLAIFILRGLLMRENAYLIWLGVSANVVLPCILIALSLLRHNDLIGAHGLALVILGALAWVPGLITLESAGGALNQIRRRNDAEKLTLATASFSRMLTLLVLLLGTFAFMQAEIVNSGNASLPNPLFFAIPFYLVIWVLFSLARSVQKAYETPRQPIMLAADFIGRWVVMMLTVLLVCTALALLLPKHPLLTLMSYVNPHWQTAMDNSLPSFLGLRPVDTPPPAADHSPTPRHDYRPLSRQPQPANSAPTDASHWQNRTASNKNPDSGGLHGLIARLSESTVDALTNIAKAGEAQHAEQTTTPPPAAGETSPPRAAAKNTQNNRPAEGTEARTQAKWAELRKLLQHHPLRWFKILLAIALFLAALLAAIFFCVAYRKKWPQRLLGYLWRLLQPFIAFLLTFYGGRLADNRREQQIAEMMRQFDPFADPLLDRGDRSPQRLVCAIYTTFIAYLWLVGYKRKEAQTEYDLALRLEENSPLNTRAVWLITRAFTSVNYAKSIPTEEDLALLHDALQTLMQDIERKVPEHHLEAMKGHYRHDFAAERLAARLAEDAAQREMGLQPAEG